MGHYRVTNIFYIQKLLMTLGLEKNGLYYAFRPVIEINKY